MGADLGAVLVIDAFPAPRPGHGPGRCQMLMNEEGRGSLAGGQGCSFSLAGTEELGEVAQALEQNEWGS